jgi:hypothetical protein
VLPGADTLLDQAQRRDRALASITEPDQPGVADFILRSRPSAR